MFDERDGCGSLSVMPGIDTVRDLGHSLPRSHEALVRGRVKFRVGRIVYVAFSRDETLMGFAFPKELRSALIESQPHRFLMPPPADQRYNWVVVRLSEIDDEEMRELVIDAWAMCVPQRVRAAQLVTSKAPPPGSTSLRHLPPAPGAGPSTAPRAGLTRGPSC